MLITILSYVGATALFMTLLYWAQIKSYFLKYWESSRSEDY